MLSFLSAESDQINSLNDLRIQADILVENGDYNIALTVFLMLIKIHINVNSAAEIEFPVGTVNNGIFFNLSNMMRIFIKKFSIHYIIHP